MKAYLLNSSGKPGVLKLTEFPEPLPGPSEVKVKVSRIGVNYAEILSRKGQYSWAPPKPYIPGMEGVGEVVEVGSEVTSCVRGDQVIFGTQYGSYAEFVIVSSHMVFPVIEKFSFEENAAFLVNFMTAWVALMRLGNIRKEDIVLIHAAAGGVGTAAVQLANKIGSTVIGTAGSDEKLEFISRLGGELAINYRKEDFQEVIKKKYPGVDLVLEVVGGNVYRKSLGLLRPFGRLIVAGYASIPLKKWNPFTWWPTWRDAPKANVMKMARGSYAIGATHIGYLIADKAIVQENWNALTDFVLANDIRPVVGKEFSFSDIAAAHQYMESRKSVGKIVVVL